MRSKEVVFRAEFLERPVDALGIIVGMPVENISHSDFYLISGDSSYAPIWRTAYSRSPAKLHSWHRLRRQLVCLLPPRCSRAIFLRSDVAIEKPRPHRVTIDVRDDSLRGGNASCFAERRLPIVLISSLAFIIGLGGALPHLFFSWDLGERTFFEGAWDEAFYSIVMSGKVAAWNDYPARALMRLLMAAAGGPNFSFAIWSDVLWPVLVVLSAGFLVLSLTRSWVIVIPATFLLVFGSDILAFNSSVIYPPQLIISYGLKSLPIALRELVPDAFTAFLYIYRTPEPQLSLSFFFCYLAIIVRFLGRQRSTSSDWVIVFCATAICTAIYVFFATACLMAAGLAVLSLARRAVGGPHSGFLWYCSRAYFSSAG